MSIRARLSDEQGIAAIVALMTTVLALLIGVAVAAATIDLSNGSRRDTAEKRAFEAAQAGLQQQVYRINQLINSSGNPASTLDAYCIGGSETSLIAPSGSVCPSYTAALGNNAYYTSWMTIGATSGTLACGGTSIAETQFTGDRCVTSQATVCPAAYTGGTAGLPCAGGSIHRVEERVSANLGQPVFAYPGVTGYQGVYVQNAPTINGTVSTNGTLYVAANATVTQPEVMGGSQFPQLQNVNGTLGACSGRSYPPGTTSWPTSCVRTGIVSPSSAPTFPATNCLGDGSSTCPDATGSWNYQTPDGDALISNAFKACGQPGAPVGSACSHDSFTGCSTTPPTGTPTYPNACGWNPITRTLAPPNGVTIKFTGGTYDFCQLQLTQVTVNIAKKSAIWIDSPADRSPSGPACPTGTGRLVFSSGGALVNPTPSDTTALQLYIYGTDVNQPTYTYNHNDCNTSTGGQNADCVQLSQGSAFSGTLEAPNADVLIANTGGTNGSVIGRTVTYANNTTFTTDAKDSSIETAALGIFYRTLWHDCGVQPATITDPMAGC